MFVVLPSVYIVSEVGFQVPVARVDSKVFGKLYNST